MVQEKPIKCPYCKKNTGYTQEQFMFTVITTDILCPHCGEVIIRANGGIEFNGAQQTPEQMHNPNVHTPTKNVNINTDLEY